MNAMTSAESNQYLLGLLIKLDRYLVDGGDNKVQCFETKNDSLLGFETYHPKRFKAYHLSPLKKNAE